MKELIEGIIQHAPQLNLHFIKIGLGVKMKKPGYPGFYIT
jgi:ABC-type tungstate transport system permease subunit